jgi:hypothetical protein
LTERGHPFPDVWSAYGVEGLAEPSSALADHPAPYPAEFSPAAHLTAATIDYVRGRRHPWFAHVTYLQPHPPFVLPEEWFGHVDPADGEAPNRLADRAAESALHPLLAAFIAIPQLTEADDWGNSRWGATYASMVAEVDDQFGRLCGPSGRRSRRHAGDPHLRSWGTAGRPLAAPEAGWYPRASTCRWSCAGGARGGTGGPPTAGTIVESTPATSIRAVLTPAQPDGQRRPAHHRARRAVGRALAGPRRPRGRRAAYWEGDFPHPQHGYVAGLGLQECCSSPGETRVAHVTFSGASRLPPLAFHLIEDPGCHVDRADDPDAAPALLAATRDTLAWRLRNTRGLLVNRLAR